MRHTMTKPSPRPEVAVRRSAPLLDQLPARSASQLSATGSDAGVAAIAAADATDDIDVDIIRAVMEARKVSVEDFATKARASRTQVGDALNKKPNRPIQYRWVLRQGPGFVADVQAETSKRLGLSPIAEREETFELMVALMRRIWMRPRQTERAS